MGIKDKETNVYLAMFKPVTPTKLKLMEAAVLVLLVPALVRIALHASVTPVNITSTVTHVFLSQLAALTNNEITITVVSASKVLEDILVNVEPVQMAHSPTQEKNASAPPLATMMPSLAHACVILVWLGMEIDVDVLLDPFHSTTTAVNAR